jgi:aspartate aminotransferase
MGCHASSLSACEHIFWHATCLPSSFSPFAGNFHRTCRDRFLFLFRRIAMFEHIPVAPPDSILGLNEVFDKDPRPEKINLTVGVFKDEQGRTPILESVRQAERRIFEHQKTKSYLPIEGGADFNRMVIDLVLGDSVDPARVAAAHTPGGTGALRAGADTIARHFPNTRIWLSNPTWANHIAVFQTAGMHPHLYTYLNHDRTGLDFDGMMSDLRQRGSAGDFVLLHVCCHNPTGIDPTPDQWRAISELMAEKKMIPWLDFAYQGFGDGLAEDAAALRTLLAHHPEMVICSSFSKNFGLYSERVGALLMVSSSPASTPAVLSQIRSSIRTNYSNPPRHGESIVATILGDAELTALWKTEVNAMRSRIATMRQAFIEGMRGLGRDFSFLSAQKGMFSYTGLNAMQADWLKTERAIYIVGTGRINVAGLSTSTLPRLCQAIDGACTLVG